MAATASATDAKLFNNRNVLTSGKQFASMKGFSAYATASESLKGNIKTYSGGALFSSSSVLESGKTDPAAAANRAARARPAGRGWRATSSPSDTTATPRRSRSATRPAGAETTSRRRSSSSPGDDPLSWSGPLIAVAGLGVSYYLGRAGLRHRVLDGAASPTRVGRSAGTVFG